MNEKTFKQKIIWKNLNRIALLEDNSLAYLVGAQQCQHYSQEQHHFWRFFITWKDCKSSLDMPSISAWSSGKATHQYWAGVQFRAVCLYENRACDKNWASESYIISADACNKALGTQAWLAASPRGALTTRQTADVISEVRLNSLCPQGWAHKGIMRDYTSCQRAGKGNDYHKCHHCRLPLHQMSWHQKLFSPQVVQFLLRSLS